jgi:epoxyqueuosine reductase
MNPPGPRLGAEPGTSRPAPESLAAACLASLRAFFAADARVLDWGIAPARPTPNAALLKAWIDDKRHAGMEYMAARLAERLDPRAFHPWAESAVVFAFPYLHRLGTTSDRYKVAAYAHGDDYHDRARAIHRAVEAHLRSDPALKDIRFYAFADTAPVFERDLASEAGLGWRGKNCCTLSRKHGSAFHLGGFFLDIPLPAAVPLEEFCGGCTRCIDQCPTEAFIAPGRLDANKCISYWTIENKGEIPPELSDRFQGWLFGCDVCQEVCPWNHKHMRGGDPERNDGPVEEAAGAAGPTLFPDSGPAWAALLRKSGGYRSRYRRTPLSRAGRRSLVRNFAIAVRNMGDTSALDPLRACLEGETDPIVIREIERTLKALGQDAGTDGRMNG